MSDASRPFTSINMASTLDGKITSYCRELPTFMSDADQRRMDHFRAENDALMVGASTIRNDNPELHVRSEEAREYRKSLGKPAGLTYIVIVGHGSLNPGGHAFNRKDEGRTIVATINGRANEFKSLLGQQAEVWECGAQHVSLPHVCNRLKQEGIETLLVEGGGTLNWYMLDADLVDQLHLTISPAILGGSDAPTIVEGKGRTMKNFLNGTLSSCKQVQDELHLTYRIKP